LPLAAKITTPFQGESMGYEMADKAYPQKISPPGSS
jgi:hypothetical protein